MTKLVKDDHSLKEKYFNHNKKPVTYLSRIHIRIYSLPNEHVIELHIFPQLKFECKRKNNQLSYSKEILGLLYCLLFTTALKIQRNIELF